MADVLRRTSLVAFVIVVGLAVASVAWASPPVIDQYYEEIPTATGGVGGSGQGGSGGGTDGGGGLPEPIRDQLESSVTPAVASELQEVATSSRLGAPRATFEKQKGGAGESAFRSAEADPVSSAVTAATDGGDAHLTILLILIGLITGSPIVAAARRRRQTPASPAD